MVLAAGNATPGSTIAGLAEAPMASAAQPEGSTAAAADNSLAARPAAACPEPNAGAEPGQVLERFQQALAEAEREHLERLQEHCRVHEGSNQHTSRRRRQAGRRRRRKLKQRVRAGVVKAYHRLRAAGCTFAEAAQRLQVKPRTLRFWVQKQACAGQEGAGPGRPPSAATLAQRNQVVAFLKEQGPAVGLPTLRQHFPDLARAELLDLQGRYREVWCRRQHLTLHVLHWQQPGRVWAMDFAEPSVPGASSSLPPIDGVYPYLLAIRDLASGYTLCWLPVRQATAEVVAQVLRQLFVCYGAPLVLKTDNGSQFRADTLQTLLARAGVTQLFSPPYWPRYNGAIEASIGSLKTRTQQQAAEHGRAGDWTWADAAAARQQANAYRNPKTVRAPTPEETWACHSAASPEERARFLAAVERERILARLEDNLGPEEELDHWCASELDRQALPRVLVGHGYLLFKRRRIPARIR